jgi:hypothetical protein
VFHFKRKKRRRNSVFDREKILKLLKNYIQNKLCSSRLEKFGTYLKKLKLQILKGFMKKQFENFGSYMSYGLVKTYFGLLVILIDFLQI